MTNKAYLQFMIELTEEIHQEVIRLTAKHEETYVALHFQDPKGAAEMLKHTGEIADKISKLIIIKNKYHELA